MKTVVAAHAPACYSAVDSQHLTTEMETVSSDGVSMAEFELPVLKREIFVMSVDLMIVFVFRGLLERSLVEEDLIVL